VISEVLVLYTIGVLFDGSGFKAFIFLEVEQPKNKKEKNTTENIDLKAVLIWIFLAKIIVICETCCNNSQKEKSKAITNHLMDFSYKNPIFV